MSVFQDKTSGVVISFPDEITLAEAFEKFPSLPKTLSENVIPRPTEGHIWVTDKWILNQIKQNLALKNLALNELTKSDTTILRFYEASLPITDEWALYRKSLRDIVSGIDTTSTTLPVKPAYVSGT